MHNSRLSNQTIAQSVINASRQRVLDAINAFEELRRKCAPGTDEHRIYGKVIEQIRDSYDRHLSR